MHRRCCTRTPRPQVRRVRHLSPSPFVDFNTDLPFVDFNADHAYPPLPATHDLSSGCSILPIFAHIPPGMYFDFRTRPPLTAVIAASTFLSWTHNFRALFATYARHYLNGFLGITTINHDVHMGV